MTIQQVLDLPTEDIAKLTDAQLDTMLAPLFPASRQVDKEAFAVKHATAVNKMAMAHIAAMGGAPAVKPPPQASEVKPQTSTTAVKVIKLPKK